MKANLIIILFCFITIYNSFAQKWELVMEGGIASFYPLFYPLIETSTKLSPSANVGMRVKIKYLSDSVSLITGFSASLKGYTENTNEEKADSYKHLYESYIQTINRYQHYYLEIPLLIKIDKYYAFIGVVGSIMLYSGYIVKETEDMYINDILYSSYETKYVNYQWELGKGYIPVPEIGFTFGIDVPVGKGFLIGSRFYTAINHSLFIRDVDYEEYQNRQILLKIGYCFNKKEKK